MTKKSWFIIISIFMTIELLLIRNQSNDKSIIEKPVTCTVLDKMNYERENYTPKTHYYYTNIFTLILQTNSGEVFQLDVLPSTYSQAKINQEITFILSDNQINYYNCAPPWPVFRLTFIIIIPFMFLVVILLSFILKDHD